MKCWKIKRQISASLDGELTLAQEMSLAEHIEQCARCRRDWELLKIGKGVLSARGSIQPPSDFMAKLAGYIENESRKRYGLWFQFDEAAKSLLPTFTALMLIILSLLILTQTVQNPRSGKPLPEQAVFTALGEEENTLLAGGEITSDQVLKNVIEGK